MANELTTRSRYPHGGNFQTGGGLFNNIVESAWANRDWVVWFNDFLRPADWGAVQAAGTATVNGWTATAIGTMTVGTISIVDETVTNPKLGGVLRVVPDATDNEGYHVQLTGADSPGEFLKPASGRTIVFEARFTCGDWDGQDYFMGLAETSATLLSAAGALTSDNLVGFHHAIADSGLIYATYTGTADANETRAGAVNTAVFTNDAFHTFGIRITDTTKLEFYLDGAIKYRKTMATAFDDNMTISFGNVGSGSAGDYMDIDYILVAATR